MTIKQAVAILDAERELEIIGVGGPDCNPGTAWNDYVREAIDVVDATEGYWGNYNDIKMIREYKGI
jgi:hypothetical protein